MPVPAGAARFTSSRSGRRGSGTATSAPGRSGHHGGARTTRSRSPGRRAGAML
ncbi:MAG: hypothetical protein ACRDYZ_16710 [Acidimicrobiales bacterium]